MTGIVSSDDVLDGAPRLEGRRIGVLRVVDLAQAESPEHAADQLDLSLAEVHTALAYYYEHPKAMQERRRQRAQQEGVLRDDSLEPSDELTQ